MKLSQVYFIVLPVSTPLVIDYGANRRIETRGVFPDLQKGGIVLK
jgi:hypothetical protein